ASRPVPRTPAGWRAGRCPRTTGRTLAVPRRTAIRRSPGVLLSVLEQPSPVLQGSDADAAFDLGLNALHRRREALDRRGARNAFADGRGTDLVTVDARVRPGTDAMRRVDDQIHLLLLDLLHDRRGLVAGPWFFVQLAQHGGLDAVAGQYLRGPG